MTVEPDNIGGSENYAGSFLNTWAIGTHNDSQNMSLVTDIDTIKQLNAEEANRYHNSDVGRAKDQAEEAKNQALRAQSMAEAIKLADPGQCLRRRQRIRPGQRSE